MAEVVIIQQGDTFSALLQRKRGVNGAHVYNWLNKLVPLNPHIGNLDKVYPGERILLPADLMENVPSQLAWQNAFSNVPQALRQTYNGPTELYFAQGGDTLDGVAQKIFPNGPHQRLPLSAKRAVLIHNNPFLDAWLPNGPLPLGTLINLSPALLPEYDRMHWQQQRQGLAVETGQLHEHLRQLLAQDAAEEAWAMTELVDWFKSLGAGVGLDDAVNGAGLLAATATGYAAAGTMALNNINALSRELYQAAVQALGTKVVHSNNARHLARVQAFLKAHPKYDQLMRQLRELLGVLLSKKIEARPPTQINYAMARHFRSQFALPLKKWGNASKYVNTMARQLNGRLGMFAGAGRCATWYVPAVLGIADVALAPPELRVRTIFEQGFGIIGGAAGTWAGSTFVGAGAVGLFMLCGLCLGPFGIFVTVFICATAGGIAGMELGKKFGGDLIYDYGSQLTNGKTIHSFDEILTGIQ